MAERSRVHVKKLGGASGTFDPASGRSQDAAYVLGLDVVERDRARTLTGQRRGTVVGGSGYPQNTLDFRGLPSES